MTYARLELKGVLMKTNSPANPKKAVVFFSILIILFMVVSVCASTHGDVPRITIHELKEMMDNGTEVTIIDTQPAAIYALGHIKGAVSLPWKSEIALEDVWALRGDILIVTYCDCGPGESDSADMASQLIKMGFDDVKVLKHPSVRGWKEAGYPMERK
jgi:rhodanese-related sulfurtransferase